MNAVDFVTTAKLRGLVKKLEIPYVDAIRANHRLIANGIHIWQLGSQICFKTFNDSNEVYLSKFISALDEIGLTVLETQTILGKIDGTYNIVPKVGA